MDGGRRIYPEEVLAKLKEDGDFYKLHLRITQKLKDKEDLRNTIVSMVKQSAVINRPCVERMNRGEISDAIYGEIGNELMNKISTGLWEMITSDDGEKNAIREAVQSTFNKLLNSQSSAEGASSCINRKRKTLMNPGSSENFTVSCSSNGFHSVPSDNNGFLTVSHGTTNGDTLISNGTDDHITVSDGIGIHSSVCVLESLSDDEPNEPPGFSMTSICPVKSIDKPQSTISDKRDSMKEPKKNYEYSNGFLKPDDIDTSVWATTEQQEQCSAMDDDPDVPPGFG